MEELEKLILMGEDGNPLAEEEPRRKNFMFPVPTPKDDLLLQACYKGDVIEILRLIKEDPTRMQTKDEGKMGPLLTAVHRNQIEAVKTILDLGADVDEPDGVEITSICYAVVLGYSDLVKLLVERGASPIGDLSVPGKNRPIHFAAVGNRIDIAEYLISKGAKLTHPGLAGGNVLRSAVIANQLDFVKWVISKDTEALWALDEQKVSIPAVAIETGATAVLKWFIEEAYVSFRVFGLFNLSFVQMVARNGAIEILRWIIQLRHSKDLRDQLEATRVRNGAQESLFGNRDIDEVIPLSARWDEQGLTAVQLAAQEAHPISLEMLLKEGLDVTKEVDVAKTNVLMWAAQKGSIPCMEIAIKYGCELEATDDRGNTALHLAALCGHCEAVKWLISLGANIEARNKYNSSPFYEAASAGHLETAKFFLDLGARTGDLRTDASFAVECSRQGALDCLKWIFETFPEKLTDIDEEQWNVFTVAISRGHIEIVNWLLQAHGTSFDLHSDIVANAVLQAAANGHLAVLKRLHGLGVSMSCHDSIDNTTVIYSANYGHPEVVEWLIKEANVDRDAWSSSYQAVHFAARRGQTAALKVLLDNGSNINQRVSDSGETLLHLAALSGSLESVQLLLDRGLKATKHTGKLHGRNFPILCAALNGHLAVIKLLIQHNTPVDIKGKSGWTIIHHAAASGYINILEYGLEHHLSLTVSDKAGYSPILLAAYNGQIEALDWLVKHGVSVFARSSAGTDVFGLAAHGNRVECMEHLMKKYRLTPTEANDTGLTPLLQAAKMGHFEAVEWLCSYGDINPHIPDYEGMDVMLYAALKGTLPVVKWLHDCVGLSLFTRHPSSGSTPFLVACRSNNMTLIKWMLSRGCNVKDVDYGNLNVIQYARDSENPEIASFLQSLLSEPKSPS